MASGMIFFRVTFTAQAEKSLVSIIANAINRNRGKEYARAFQKLFEDITYSAARDRGEPLFNLQKTQLLVRVYSQTPLSFLYGVHAKKPEALVSRVVDMQPI